MAIALPYHLNETFDIGIDTSQGLRYFDVIPSIIGDNAQYEIRENKQHIFSLACCFDEVGDSLKLSPEFEDKRIGPALVVAVAEINPKRRTIIPGRLKSSIQLNVLTTNNPQYSQSLLTK